MGFLLRLGISRGFLGGNRFFSALGVIALVFRAARKLGGSEPKTLFTHKMEPGEAIVISDGTKPV